MEIQQNTCLGACTPKQIINFDKAFNSIDDIKVYNDCRCEYKQTDIEYAYSVDNVCWSCYLTYDQFLQNTIELKSDFYIRFKIQGGISKISINCIDTYDYTTSLASGFNFTACDGSINTNTNLWNPYANMDCAIGLQQQLTETVACMFGIPIYYFKLAPNIDSKDIFFKEYALMGVEAVKQIKMIIQDNQMPSSKPEFSDFGIDWQTDWEVEIAKGMFATAFGNTAQPMEGDLIYVPMMKRMWMINESYEEKKDALMWTATTFKVTLVKYEEKASVDLGDTESLVNTFVKNKYDDLFGEEETLDSGTESVDAPKYAASTLYPVFESDAIRKYVTSSNIDFYENNLYHKGQLITDNCYKMSTLNNDAKIIYQKQYCGTDGSVSFIVNFLPLDESGDLLNIGNLTISFKQTKKESFLYIKGNESLKIKLMPTLNYFVWLRWSKEMNLIEFSAALYTYPQNIPIYKLQNHHYYFDIDNAQITSSKYNKEMIQETKGEVIMNHFYGQITNLKLFDVYNDNISELLQMYPTHQHLLINDTARKLVDLAGVTLR